MLSDPLGWLAFQADSILSGVIGGFIGAGMGTAAAYFAGWRKAGRFEGADFHIAATMYTVIDAANPAHEVHLAALASGKTHVQELIWLGQEVSLQDFISNPYLVTEVCRAMARARNEGLLIGAMPERVERPLLKKIVGHHNAIPANDIVHAYKRHVGTDASGRVSGISPPTHEHYDGSPHRRVLRAMFIADSQLRDGLPPEELVHFPQEGHRNRYRSLATLTALYRENPERFARCRAYF